MIPPKYAKKVNVTVSHDFSTDATFEIGNISTTEHDVIIEGYGFSYSSLNSYQFDENGDEAVYDVNVGSPMHLCIENANWENNPDAYIGDVEQLSFHGVRVSLFSQFKTGWRTLLPRLIVV